MKPPFTYFGGKTAIAEKIAALLPPHEHYVEPFAGSLAVLLAKAPSVSETVNDFDHSIVTFWKVLREQPEELARLCALTPHSRAEYGAAWRDADGDLEQARRVWVRITQNRGRTLKRCGWWYVVTRGGSAASPSRYLEGYVARMADVAERLHGVSLECRPALEVIADYGHSARTLIYADPPYPEGTRSENNYACEMAGEGEHRELAETLHTARAAVVLSGYESPLYGELYSGWYRHEIPTQTGNGGSDRARTEVLWSNRPFPQADLFDGMAAS